MRWKSGQREETHQHLLSTAGALFRRRGFTQTSIADVMGALGLTVGGFYAHFTSKEALLEETLAVSFGRMRTSLSFGLDDVSGAEFVREVTRRYLSRMHRDNVDVGCPLPSLAAEVGRLGDGPRDEITHYLHEITAMLEQKAPTSTDGIAPRDLALGLVAMSVGGLLLSRAVRDEALSDAILAACRRLAASTVHAAPPSPRTETT